MCNVLQKYRHTDHIAMSSDEDSLNENKEPTNIETTKDTNKDALKVYSTSDQLINNLHDPRFKRTERMEEADILFMFKHYHDFG